MFLYVLSKKNHMKINLNNYLEFDSYFEDIFQKVGKKLNAFSRLTNHMELAKKETPDEFTF